MLYEKQQTDLVKLSKKGPWLHITPKDSTSKGETRADQPENGYADERT